MSNETNTTQASTATAAPETKFCSECGEKIAKKAVICPHCGCRTEPEEKAAPQIVINNQNQNQNATFAPAMVGHAKNKWVALLLCWFLGWIGGHKFYEGKTLLGVVYLFTCGLFGIGVLVDFFALLFKPTTYYV